MGRLYFYTGAILFLQNNPKEPKPNSLKEEQRVNMLHLDDASTVTLHELARLIYEQNRDMSWGKETSPLLIYPKRSPAGISVYDLESRAELVNKCLMQN